MTPPADAHSTDPAAVLSAVTRALAEQGHEDPGPDAEYLLDSLARFGFEVVEVAK